MPFLSALTTTYIGDGKSALAEELIYEYSRNRVILVPVGFITDFASIPRIFRPIITGNDDTMPPAVIHDYLYNTQPDGVTRGFADWIFLLAMSEKEPPELEVPVWKRTIVYLGVRVGGWIFWNLKRNRK